MKNKIQILVASLFVFGFASVMNTAKAQTANNTIEEIQLTKNDTFNDIRSRLMENFDLTNVDYKQGTVNSVVKFDIAKNGKIVNVHSNGDCKNVSKEIETVLSELDYRVDRKKVNDNMVAYTYVMPVTVEINNR
jgi:archaellum component FlaF (FlaF/FlaG flagellin family)